MTRVNISMRTFREMCDAIEISSEKNWMPNQLDSKSAQGQLKIQLELMATRVHGLLQDLDEQQKTEMLLNFVEMLKGNA